MEATHESYNNCKLTDVAQHPENVPNHRLLSLHHQRYQHEDDQRYLPLLRIP